MSEHEYFLDTNIFLRIVTKDDARKAADCEKLVQRIREGKLRGRTSNLVCAEFVWTCLGFYRIPKPDVVKLIRGMVSIPHLTIQDAFDPLRAVDHYESASIKFVDALLASHNAITEHGATIVSYDRDFDTLGIERLEPDQVLRQQK